VGEDRDGRPQQLNQEPAQRRAGKLGSGPAGFQLGVAFDQFIPLHQRRQVRLVGDIEEDRADTGQERGDIQLPQVQHVQRPGERDRPEDRCSAEVTRDQDRPTAEPVHPYACGKPPPG